jgi:hypothetical protein
MNEPQLRDLRKQLVAELEKREQLEKDLAIARPLAGKMFDENYELKQQLLNREQRWEECEKINKLLEQQLAAEREKAKMEHELHLATIEYAAGLADALAFYAGNRTHEQWDEHTQFDLGARANAALAKVKL